MRTISRRSIGEFGAVSKIFPCSCLHWAASLIKLYSLPVHLQSVWFIVMKRVVFNQKGGVGKTSITCNLAAIRTGVEYDPFPNEMRFAAPPPAPIT